LKYLTYTRSNILYVVGVVNQSIKTLIFTHMKVVNIGYFIFIFLMISNFKNFVIMIMREILTERVVFYIFNKRMCFFMKLKETIRYTLLT